METQLSEPRAAIRPFRSSLAPFYEHGQIVYTNVKSEESELYYFAVRYELF